jgi:hypothetical protein
MRELREAASCAVGEWLVHPDRRVALVFGNETFRYVREFSGNDEAVLEFLVTIDGIEVNGVDMIRWNEEGRIVDFKVMLRPLKAINLIHQKMGAMLQVQR